MTYSLQVVDLGAHEPKANRYRWTVTYNNRVIGTDYAESTPMAYTAAVFFLNSEIGKKYFNTPNRY